jgi:acetyl/propionyl-CoA carboxylase alpha subunit/acetyl-CoA carboxylase carboxyltransferase component
MRLIHAVRELGAAGERPIRTIALYTDPERGAMFVREADEAHRLGPAIVIDEDGHRRSGYLDFAALESALVATRADAAWVGWGFVAEDPAFAELCERLRIVFVGPDAAVMRLLGDKTEAKLLAEQAGVPVQRLSSPARQVDVQVIADGQGTAWALGVRDCSVQRRNQKVIEESASTALSPEQDRQLRDGAVRLALEAGYRGACTVEFLYHPLNRVLSFMQVNPCLQVEHCVTEAATGADLVKLQLHVAAGGRLPAEPPASRGHAVQARLNAEDPALDFAPAPGRVELLRLPTGPGLRIDTGVGEGDVIPAEFDSMIAKIIAWGSDRTEALSRLHRALSETTVVIDGRTTNQAFLLDLLQRSDLRAGEIDTAWLDELQLRGETVPSRHGEVAVLSAAIELADEITANARARFFAFARRGRPQIDTGSSQTIELRHRGRRHRVAVNQIGPDSYRLQVQQASIEVEVQRLGRFERRLQIGDRVHRTVISEQGAELLVGVDGVPHRIARDEGGIVRSRAPAVVVAIPVTAGDVVRAGDVVAVVESMKMESSYVAPLSGRVADVLTAANMHVGSLAPIVRIEPLDGRESLEEGANLDFTLVQTAAELETPARCRDNLQRLERLALGYDIEPAEVTRIVADLHGACADMLACDPALISGEHRLLEVYANLLALTRPQRELAEPGEDLLHSPQEYLHEFLRSLDAGAEGLPEQFVKALERALAHYGITGLERTPVLEDACYRLLLADHRNAATRAAIMAILDRRLEQSGDLVGHVGEDFRGALAGLVAAAEGRDQVLADLARETRFIYFDQPVIAAATDRAYAEMEQHLDALATDADAGDRQRRIEALVACPRPLSPLLSRRLSIAPAELRRPLLEAMTRRFYRTRKLRGFEEIEVEGHRILAASYDRAGHTHHVLTAFVELSELVSAARACAHHAAGLPAQEPVMVDLYSEHADTPPAQLAQTLGRSLDAVKFPAATERIVVAITAATGGRGMSAMDLFTFRTGPGGLIEDEPMRGLHPTMFERLALWRLQKFALERIPSGKDIYLFHGVARDNPGDERLFAVAEVRDLTPVRGDDGRVIALPELEQMLVEALEGIRTFQSHRPASRRLQWNRLFLYVWPEIDLSRDEISGLIARLAPAAYGLGLEMLLLSGRVRESDGRVRPRVLRIFATDTGESTVEIDDQPARAVQPLDEGARRMIAARRRGMLHPAEIVKLLTSAHAAEFSEFELDERGDLTAVDRPPATNTAGVVVGVLRNFTDRYPEGMARVALFGDPSLALGSLAEPECRRIMAALDKAQREQLPIDWFAISAGAKIAMDSGTETMDWIAAALRRIIEFTQAGGEINVVVTGINVGAQPYFNAEATMLMHTRGILVMTPASAMVLTGKQALDYSGAVSAEDNFGIGGYERIMGGNGQGQYWAHDLAAACRILLAHHEHAYVAPGERFPRRAGTSDPFDRDVRAAPHAAPGSALATVGDVFSGETNAVHKQPFDIRSVMRATIDSDHAPLERWPDMRGAETAVVWDAHLGGWPVTLLGIESHPLARRGFVPADGPEQWSSGTLFPRSAKKIARAINAASARRPVVMLANLAGFDGSPESMRESELEYGAEIGRAVVNFDGPIVFCVISRFHGGAFVVFSQKLNQQLETVALEGTYASVIGGAPAAGVVFVREVEQNARDDPRITALDGQIEASDGLVRQALRAQREALFADVVAEKRGELAARFEATHSAQRAVRVGSVRRIIAPATLRPYLIDAVERGIRSTSEHELAADPIGG